MPDSTTHSEFADIFSRSREILLAHSRSLVLVRDEPGDIYLNTAHQMKNGQPLFFGAAAIRKQYVSFHLMPVYVFPELLHSIPTQLERRRHGKSCFNIKHPDDVIFAALEQLTAHGISQYRRAGYVPD
ncbi:MAG: hypothetical protein C0629_01740 [Chromatiales bacterium]|nr:MAG: hypothetical protein C0629_01740 [Chromatiales bacterium]